MQKWEHSTGTLLEIPITATLSIANKSSERKKS